MADRKHTPGKILMTTDTVGGVWTYCMELCRALPDLEFHLVTSGGPIQEGQNKELAGLTNVVVYETGYLLEWMDNPWCDIDASGEWLLQLEEEVQPDLVHLNSYSYGTLPFKAPKIVVTHSDVYSWWLAVKGGLPPAEWSEYFQRVQAGLQGADLVIAPSEAKLNSIRKIYGIRSPTKTIYNGRNSNLFYKQEKLPRIFSMGRVWDEAKNICLLVNAASALEHETRIAGDQQFENNAVHVDAPNTTYLGKLETSRVAEELSTAALYVLPAKYEPFGLSVLEAAYSGCALVLGDIPSLREIWGDSAVFVATNDAAALTDTIQSILNNREQLEALSRKAEERARLFSSRLMAEAYREVYSQLMEPELIYLKQETL